MISKRKFNEIISRKRGYDELIGKLYDLGVDVRTEKDEFDAIGAFFDEILAENFDDTGVELVYLKFKLLLGMTMKIHILAKWLELLSTSLN